MMTFMPSWTAIGATVAPVLLGAVIALSAPQLPAVRSVDEKIFREYAGAYQWEPDASTTVALVNEVS